MESFEIDFLDHVAIKVRNVDVSVNWYEKVLGLKKYSLPEWGERPVLMLSNKCGVAIFPVSSNDAINEFENNIRIHHFAFHVSSDNFKKAKQHFEHIGQEYEFQDHTYFHSIYVKDPDGHIVELTSIVVDEKSFYK